MSADPKRLMAQYGAELEAKQDQELREDSRRPDPMEGHAALMIVSGAGEAIGTAQQTARKASAPLAAADAAMANIDGQRDAQRLIHAVRQGCAPADAVLEGIHQVQAFGEARLRGFARELQKTIEHFASRHGRD